MYAGTTSRVPRLDRFADVIRARRRFRAVRPVRQLGAAAPSACLDISDWGRPVCLTRTQLHRLFGGRPPGPPIGTGGRASVFASPRPDRVVKLTIDPEDVAGLLRGQGSRHLVEVDAAYELPQGTGQIDGDVRRPLYAVVVERVRPLPAGLSTGFRAASTVLRSHGGQPAACARFAGMTAAEQRVCGQVVEAHNDLRQRGVNWEDRSWTNAGYDAAGQFKVLDVGSPGDMRHRLKTAPPTVPTLERRRRRRTR